MRNTEGADVIIADDVESANNSMTQLMRDRLGETVKEFEAILKPEGRIIFLGTPQSEETLYNSLTLLFGSYKTGKSTGVSLR